AVSQVIGRHDALRMTFDNEGKTLIFASGVSIEIPVEDLSGLGVDERNNRFNQILERDASTPFKLNQGPLVRVQLVRIGPDDQKLIFTAHHIVCDGWSTNI